MLRLSQMDVRRLSEPEQLGASLTLASDLFRFGLMGPLLDHPDLSQQTLAARFRTNPSRWLGPLTTKLKDLLVAVADGQRIKLPTAAASHMVFDGHALKRFEPLGFEGGLGWRMGAGSLLTFRLSAPLVSPHSLAVCFLFNAMRQLDSEQGIMVRRCQYERCRELFLANRPKQVYCGRSCVNALNFERHKNKDPQAYRTRHRDSARKSWNSAGARQKRKRVGGSVGRRSLELPLRD